MKAHSRTRATRTAGRTGVGLALAATTVAAMTVPAGATGLAPTVALTTLGATALAPTAAVAPVTPLTLMSTYRVQAGDTVSAIAARTGSSVAQIVRANNLNSRALIKVGQVLRLPGAAATPAPAVPAAQTSSTHTVRAGDTVSALAKRYGTTVSAIVQANDLNSRALIIVGQRLTIPGSGATGSGGSSSGSTGSGSTSSGTTSRATSHTVVAGDTVSVLAARYGTTVSAITSANSLSNAGLIYVGQRLAIPGSGGASAPATGSTGSSSSGSSSSGSSSGSGTSTSATTHTVRSGDTVSALAARYRTTVSAITSANNLRSAGLIYVGQRLTIPAGTTTPVNNSSGQQLVGDTFLGRTYASSVVAAANANKAALLAMDVPSRDQMRAMVRDTAVRMGVDPALALAVAHQESGFDARAVSPANAVGVMQVIPSSGEWASDLVGRRLNLLNPQDNVTAGVAILRQLVRSADNFDQAVAGYYQGLAGVRRNGMYADTRNYVAGIKNLMRQY